MKWTLCAVGLAGLCLTWPASAPAGTRQCPPDSVEVGSVCVDRYEASVWQIAPSNTSLVEKVLAGNATLADLTSGGAVQLGFTGPPFNQTAYPANFPYTGQWTPVPGSNPPSPGVYAVSIPGVRPSTCMTWFQAAQACRLSGKRLLTNLEWQDAADGTPDPGTDNGTSACSISTAGPVNTGSRANCTSSWGVFDMAANLAEWVTDWADLSDTGCTDWTTATGVPGSDFSCVGDDGSPKIPGALIRGGLWDGGTDAGVFAVIAFNDPLVLYYSSGIGFRCAR